MATLENLQDNIATTLTASSYVVRASWGLPDFKLTAATSHARVKITQTELLTTGSNVSIRTAEATIEIARLSAGVESADFDALETLVNGYISDLTDPDYWAGVTGVRQSPLPEVEIESEPERIGLVISFGLRVRVALEA